MCMMIFSRKMSTWDSFTTQNISSMYRLYSAMSGLFNTNLFSKAKSWILAKFELSLPPVGMPVGNFRGMALEDRKFVCIIVSMVSRISLGLRPLK